MEKLKSIKKVRADNKFELMFLVRKYKKNGWQQGNIERYPSEFKTWVCYMTRSVTNEGD